MTEARGAEGKKVWFVPDGYLPEKSSGEQVSHEALCVLNTGAEDARMELTVYFADREPMRGFAAECPAERTNHVRLDEISDGQGRRLPRGVPYAVKVESSRPVFVQHSRLDTSQRELALMSTMACGMD